MNTFNTITSAISENLIKVYENKPKHQKWKVLLPIEQLVTGYGKLIEQSNAVHQWIGLDSILLTKTAKLSFSQYQHRLYTSPLRTNTKTEFITISGFATGAFTARVISENEDNSRLLRTVEINANDATFTLPPISISDILSGDSLFLEIIPKTVTKLSSLTWLATCRDQQYNTGLRVVLIRTFGNRHIVQENLDRLAEYLRLKRTDLINYLFIVYDARSENDQLNVNPELNLLYLQGGNYGGGGNASFLIAALIKAHELCPQVEIDEVVIWDDDAIIEPQIFLRHDGYISVRKHNVAHTGIVFAKTSANKIQEYGALWGSFFDLETSQPSLSSCEQRQMFPYLVRYNRDVTKEWDRKYIGSDQNIDFGTFIYISIPYKSLSNCGGTIPFFLRNDDVELGLRLKKFGNEIIVNQNMYAWHEASHNLIGEFYATLHGMAVNCTYFKLEKSWLLKQLMSKILGASSVHNTALLESYRQAFKLFIAGPNWLRQPDCFDTYYRVSTIINRRLKNYYQIPTEVIEVLKSQNKVEVHILTNAKVRRENSSAEVVFFDPPNRRYLKPNSDEYLSEPEIIENMVHLLGLLTEQFEQIVRDWAEFISSFDGATYWNAFFSANPDHLRIGNVLVEKHPISTLSLTLSPNVAISSAQQVTAPPQYAATSTRSTSGELTTPISSNPANKLAANLPEDFSADNYYKLNPDVESAGVDAALHYLTRGISEGRRYR